MKLFAFFLLLLTGCTGPMGDFPKTEKETHVDSARIDPPHNDTTVISIDTSRIIAQSGLYRHNE